ncbi:MAG: hypothetical protein ACMUIU_10080 [bacterium]
MNPKKTQIPKRLKDPDFRNAEIALRRAAKRAWKDHEDIPTRTEIVSLITSLYLLEDHINKTKIPMLLNYVTKNKYSIIFIEV